MKRGKEEYCDQCFCSFGLAEIKKYKDGKVFHICCLKRFELQETIVNGVKREKNNEWLKKHIHSHRANGGAIL